MADDLNVTKENQRKAIKKSKFSISENSEPLHERSKKSKVDDDEDILAKKAKKVLNKSSKKKAVLDFGEAEEITGMKKLLL